MKLRLLLGWGIVIYAVLHLVWSGLVMHGLSGGIASRVIMLAALVALAATATRSLRLISERDVFVYAGGWVVVAMLLDAAFTVPATGWRMYADWNVWVGYGILFVVPLIVTAATKRRSIV